MKRGFFGRERFNFVVGEVALEALFLLFSYVVYQVVTVAFGWAGPVVAVPLFLFSGSFLLASLLSLKYKHSVVVWYHRFVMYWIGFLGFLFGASILFVLLMDAGPVFSIFLSAAAAGEISFGVTFVAFIYATWQSQRVEVTPVTISLPKIPSAWKGKRIVFMSDSHFGSTRGVIFARKIVRKIQALEPEAILVGGDLFDGVKCIPQKLIEPFRNLKAPLGVYFVSGNHDYIVDSEKCFSAITSVGMRILHNEIVDLQGIDLIGVDYGDTESREGFGAVMKAFPIDPARANILLKHVPDNVDLSERYGVSLQLSGHTHNGQIWPLSYCGYLFKEFYYGLHRLGNMQIYVSSGVGTRGSPLRLGTKSEIVAITLT